MIASAAAHTNQLGRSAGLKSIQIKWNHIELYGIRKMFMDTQTYSWNQYDVSRFKTKLLESLRCYMNLYIVYAIQCILMDSASFEWNPHDFY